MNRCIVCDEQTIELMNLGLQTLNKIQHPLNLHSCNNCFHTQLNDIVNPEILYKNYISKTKDYLYEFAIYMLMRLGTYNSDHSDIEPTELKVLDIACYDGSQLDAFQRIEENNLGVKITRVGVDPAELFFGTSKNKSHDIYCQHFTLDTVEKLTEIYGTFDIIIAHDILAKIDQPNNFLSLCKRLLSWNGMLFVQTVQLQPRFKSICHGNVSFFKANSMKYLCERNDLHLSNVSSVNNEYTFEIVGSVPKTTNVYDVIYEEMCQGLYSEELSKIYKYDSLIYKNNFHNKILEYVLKGYKIVGLNVNIILLNACRLSENDFYCIFREFTTSTPGLNYLVNIDISNCVFVNFDYDINSFTKELKANNKNGMIKVLNANTLQEYFIFI